MDKKVIKQLLDTQTKSINTMIEKRFDLHTQTIEKRLDLHTQTIEKRFENQTKELVKEAESHERVILEEFEHRLSVVAEMVVDHTEKLNAIMEIGAMNTETLEFVKSMLKRRVDIDEYEKLEKRVSVLEKKLRLSGV